MPTRGALIDGQPNQEGYRVGSRLVNGPLMPDVPEQLPERRIRTDLGIEPWHVLLPSQ